MNGGTSSATLTNVTMTNNRADADGSDGVSAATGTGGGINQVSSNSITLRNTIVAGNFNDAVPGLTADDIFGVVDSASAFNLIGTGGSGGLTSGGANSNQVNVANPGLGALADNGGLTKTHLLLPGSPAINTADTAFTSLSALDQRGFARLIGGRLDIGAVEVNYTITATAGMPQSSVIGNAFSTNLQATVKESNIARKDLSVTFTAGSAGGATGTFPGSFATASASTDSSGIALRLNSQPTQRLAARTR